MTDIKLDDVFGANDLNAYMIEDGVSISVFDFECTLSNKDTKKLVDFLNNILEKAEDKS